MEQWWSIGSLTVALAFRCNVLSNGLSEYQALNAASYAILPPGVLRVCL
uniref:Uncharacterized protein n=1 Tax=Anguilla anguilla TaxID=7936 RepID=A0A0E9UR15_ANGAN